MNQESANIYTTFTTRAVWEISRLSQLRAFRHEMLEVLADVSGTAADQVPKRLSKIATPHSIVLVANELVTNAIIHGTPPATVTVGIFADLILVDVQDFQADVSPITDWSRPQSEGGFGMRLTTQLSTKTGWRKDGNTKHVWAIFRTKKSEKNSEGSANSAPNF